ncbi:MAG: hypothetical protein GX442_23890 [Candidatus Riflebacteria bacterium]|nr:hypothetical protein [Candidatus Riflebacteria bacterium]
MRGGKTPLEGQPSAVIASDAASVSVSGADANLPAALMQQGREEADLFPGENCRLAREAAYQAWCGLA